MQCIASHSVPSLYYVMMLLMWNLFKPSHHILYDCACVCVSEWVYALFVYWADFRAKILTFVFSMNVLDFHFRFRFYSVKLKLKPVYSLRCGFILICTFLFVCVCVCKCACAITIRETKELNVFTEKMSTYKNPLLWSQWKKQSKKKMCARGKAGEPNQSNVKLDSI